MPAMVEVIQSPGGKVTIRAAHVKGVIHGATVAALEAFAFEVEGQAKANVVKNDQIDTGFMLNSIYTVTRANSSYSQAVADARSRAASDSQTVAPEVSLTGPDVHAAVACGANYAIHQEAKKSFLYSALALKAPSFGAAIQGAV